MSRIVACVLVLGLAGGTAGCVPVTAPCVPERAAMVAATGQDTITSAIAAADRLVTRLELEVELTGGRVDLVEVGRANHMLLTVIELRRCLLAEGKE